MYVYIVFYSRYGNTALLADAIAEGVAGVDGIGNRKNPWKKSRRTYP